MADRSAADVKATTSQSRLIAYLMLALVALLWAANTNIARATAEEVPPMALTFWRLFLSALVFAPFALHNTWRHRRVVMQHFWLLNRLAFLSMAAFNGLVYLGMQYTVAINGNLLQGSLPICIMVAGILFARRKVTARQGIGVALGLLGLMTIVIRGDIGLLLDMRINPGDPLVFLGVFGSATYAVFLYNRPESLDLLTFMFLTMVFGTFQILPFFLVEHIWFRSMPLTQTAILTVGFIALFPSVLAQTFFAEGVRRIGAAKAGYMIYLTPVFGVIMATGILGEPFEAYHAVGIALIATGIWLATFARARKVDG
ncbi:MAG: hypothetical protein CBC23_004555 [Rhodospirillaceae bacterium TMED63]|nr:hypothetical protein [Rhodospirillaceae bacterium]RPG01528.1 MAG: hypothetical protein CBC23_004555 [Rhodospirillaceae bacterium TMED63]